MNPTLDTSAKPERSASPSPADSITIAARRTGGVAIVFCCIVLLLLLANSLYSRALDPMKAARLQNLLLDVNLRPQDEKLKQEARRLDAEVRTNYFRSTAFAMSGFTLLLGGIAVFLLAMETVRACRRELPQPRATAGQEALLSLATARRSLIALGGLSAGVLLTLAVLSRHDTAAEYARSAARPAAARSPSSPTAEATAFRTPPAQTPLAAPGGSSLPVAGSTSPGALTGNAPASATQPAAPPLPAGGSLQPTAEATASLRQPSGNEPKSFAASSAAGIPRRAIAIRPAYPASWGENWPGFRGPAGTGVASMTEAPKRWDAPKGQGVLWKTPVPLPGWNSPVVWGDNVFLSGADSTRREIFCFNANDGTLRWRKPVPMPTGGSDIKVSNEAGYAPSTMVTDGKRACAIFVNGDVACFDFSGRLLWLRRLGVPDNPYGHAASLALYGNGVIVQMDQHGSPKEPKSSLLALDIATGNIVWRISRAVQNSWSTPILIRAGEQEQLITTADPWVIAYDPRTGRELWRADCLGGEVAPSPTFGGGYVLACSQGYGLSAIRPNSVGDVTKTAVAWTFDENLPDIVSPLSDGERVYLVTTEGLVTCVDAKRGQKLWEHNFKTKIHASPVLVGKTVYLVDTSGVTRLFEAGNAFQEVGAATLGEEISATPAFAGGRIYLRGKDHLYCIGER